ncbi:hypothetical protein U0070_011392 [Myodes glareolus]|uniref:Uncharacterized protein n=1 Tax=Myodes glareolus TaxID=447135 RepID=A0AAW0H2E0_MYOGA
MLSLKIYERFYLSSKQCSRCCKWNLCNEFGPHIGLFKEQPGKASERRHRYTGLFLPGFMVLAAPGLADLSLL